MAYFHDITEIEQDAIVIAELIESYDDNKGKFKGLTLEYHYDGALTPYDLGPHEVYFMNFIPQRKEGETVQVGSPVQLKFDIEKTCKIEGNKWGKAPRIPRWLKSIKILDCPCEYDNGDELYKKDHFTIDFPEYKEGAENN